MENALFQSVVDRTLFIKGVYANKKKLKDSTEKKLTKLKNEKDILDKSEKVFKHLIDKLAKNELSKMDKLVTYGLNSVFKGRDIKFKSEIQERGKKIWIDMQTSYNNSVVDSESTGSVHVVESFILRLLCIIKMKRSRFILMDETFSAIHNMYIENLSTLIKELTSKLNMDILLVTHNYNFADYAKNAYQINQIENGVKVEKTR